MDAVSNVRSILVFLAYVFDIFCSLILLAALIWLLRVIPELHGTWMPSYYNGQNRKDYIDCWEKISIVGIIILFLVLAGTVYLAIKFIFPAVISFAQNI